MNDELQRIIAEVGGLHTAADLARRWGVSRQAIDHMIAHHPDFPSPVLHIGRSAVYAGNDCAQWRTAHPRGNR